ncbi:MAG TPA: YihY/virulence factor BrkB family protein [Phycisphaerae bacterium]|nr:YihY/virulence factor BrkB family protein [Phycisphaerae bacterium]HRY67065.1 YihY/virulence factor BrkB family protein [Phycisphaerae bacterium]HSA27762.1 YihY/virulence factor BrkB family protein [Phycisphaerae bacterium]
MTATPGRTTQPPVPPPQRIRYDLLGQATSLARHHGRMWRIGAALLWNHNVTAMSAALSFRTIFAMVPVLVLAFLVLKSVGVLEDSKQGLRSVLQASGFGQIALTQPTNTAPASPSVTGPPSGEQVVNLADEIERLVENVEGKLTVGRLGPVGIVLLIYTATTLLTSMERSLNRIFSISRSRSLARRVPLYWSVMTLGPVLVVAASYLGQRTTKALEQVSGVSWLLAACGHWVAPVAGYLLLFFGLYKLLPNADVSWRAALGGALFAVPVWLVAKWLFALYVREIVATGNLYGALGLVPIFLVWLNLSWLIFMYGAELAYVAGNLANLQGLDHAELAALEPHDLLAAALAIARPYEAGGGAVSLDEVRGRLRLTDQSARQLLEQLGSVGAVCPVAGDGPPMYVLARPANKIPVLEILGVLRPERDFDTGRYDPEIIATIRRFQQRSQTALGDLTVGDLIRAET